MSKLYANCIKAFLVLCFFIQISACSTSRMLEPKDGAPNDNVDVSQIASATPKHESLCKYGNPSSYVANGNSYQVLKDNKGYEATGVASWYGTKFHNRLTSCREPYDMYKMTAAHPTLPLPTYVKVINLENHKEAIVRVNDRGPFEKNRLIDLSYVAAKKLGVLAKGTAPVKIIALNPTELKHIAKKPANIPAQEQSQIYLQVGAFKHLDNAKKLKTNVNRLIATAPCHIHPIKNHNQQTIYRVQVGPISDAKTADKITTALRSA